MLSLRRGFASCVARCQNKAARSPKNIQAQYEAKRQEVINPRFINGFESQTTYDPFDFSMAKLKFAAKQETELRKTRLTKSLLNAKEVNPLDFYLFPKLLSQNLFPVGTIKHRSVTQLKPKKQVLMTRAVKRAVNAGFLGTMSRDVVYSPRRGETL